MTRPAGVSTTYWVATPTYARSKTFPWSAFGAPVPTRIFSGRMPTATRPVRPFSASGETLTVVAAVERDRARAGGGAREQVRDPEEARDEGGLRLLVELVRRAELLDPALVHDRDRVRHRHRLLLVVRDVDERDPDVVLDRLQLELHLLAELEVERPERLVEEQHVRLVHERAREGDTLLLASRELPRLALLHPLEVDELEDLAHASGQLGRRARPGAACRTRRSRRSRGAGRARSSGRRCSRSACRAVARRRRCRRGRSRPSSDPRSRRSCGGSSSCRSPRAEEREELARFDRQRDPVHRDDVVEFLRDVLEADVGRCWAASAWSSAARC